MKTHFISKLTTYNGTQLRSHWNSDQTGEFGDSIVSFIGPADVKLTEMVDLEDVRDNAPIFSHSMLHFIVEHFEADLEKGILLQRLLISIIQQELLKLNPATKIIRSGDDLYDRDFKLTVSIATSSPISTLIHAAINIISKNTPVKTKGLNDYGIDPKAFAKKVMIVYAAEVESVRVARCKVKVTK